MTTPNIGLVVYDRESRPDAMLAGAVQRLKTQGVRVGGLLQDSKVDEGSRCASLQLEDIATGRRVPIFENRGAETRGCRLDPAGLVQAAFWLPQAIEAGPDVLFVNRFGRQEADGNGLVDEIAAAILADIPVVVAVGAALLPEWVAYSGDRGTRLEDADELEAWCLWQAGARSSAPSGRAPQLEGAHG
jgi:nucleoside-triphosphatase THEP1